MRLFPASPINVIDFGQTPSGTFKALPSGPMVGDIGKTVLTNKKSGPPGKHFTKQQKNKFIDGIYQEGLLAKEALARLDNSELAIAERRFAKADKAYRAILDNRVLAGYSSVLNHDVDRAYEALQEAKATFEALKKADDKRRAVAEAKARIRAAIDKAKRH